MVGGSIFCEKSTKGAGPVTTCSRFKRDGCGTQVLPHKTSVFNPDESVLNKGIVCSTSNRNEASNRRPQKAIGGCGE